jgi:beta-galactosidase
LNDGWRFQRGDPPGAEALSYSQARAWVLPSGNAFLTDPARRAPVPTGNLGEGVAYLAADYDDGSWRSVNLPHDYAIEGPYTSSVSSSMGRLPSTGVGWYRKSFTVAEGDADKAFFIDVDGAMSFSMVWVNGRFAGGWPNGYASYRVNVTSLVQPGRSNSLVVRVDNPVPADANWQSGWSRWYPGAGIYRNVWLVSADRVHVAQWGTHVTTPEVTTAAAAIQLDATVDNDSAVEATTSVSTDVYELDASGARVGAPVATLGEVELTIPAGSSGTARTQGELSNPKLWGPPPTQTPHRYVAVTRVRRGEALLDRYETAFGVRTVQLDPNQGVLVNGEHVKLNGVCNHHDLGPLGAAFNYRARERQLQILAEMGSNAIRTAHNPFEPEFFELADRMGFLVVSEAFDVWEQPKAAFDYNVLFSDWHEQDLRALIRRDRNHPSVLAWSIGNEVGEQQNNTTGPALAQRLTEISHEEDPTRLTTAGMNAAEPDDPFSVPIDTIGLNYQGTGVRDRGAQYPTYHERFPNKFVYGSETVSTFSSRGVYLFPVAPGRAEPAVGSSGVDATNGFVSSYDLYHADWSASPDEEFESQEKWSFVGGEFVWTGFDYLGEPTPLDSVASSSYFGILDLAGLKKDRFYLYQSRWRPDHAMAHILPHWTWPERIGQVTPVHVYTSGDSAELFVNGVSQGIKSKGQYEYRLRWDDVVYQPGEVSVIAYKGGVEWARDAVQTASAAAKLQLMPDRATIAGDGRDLSFVTLSVLDVDDRLVPRATNSVSFSVSGPGELVATANGDQTNRSVFSSAQRSAFSGLAVAIVRALPEQAGEIVVTATSPALAEARVSISAR